MLTSPSAVVDLRSAVYVHEPVHHLHCVSVLELIEGLDNTCLELAAARLESSSFLLMMRPKLLHAE